MREITTHMIPGYSEDIRVKAVDDPGYGGANHAYWLQYSPKLMRPPVDIEFQNGPIAEVGVNGVTHEALLAILIDRLQCFQRGPFACEANKLALEALESAMAHLKSRTLARIARGVEGTHQV